MKIPQEFQNIICRHQKELENIPDEWLRVVGMGGYNKEAGRRDSTRIKILENKLYEIKTNDLAHLEQSVVRLSEVVEKLSQKITKAGL